ncbi:MAG: ATP-dependent zinc metalloprotease FtsH [Clostridia bacterium]|nr:ATP-dependent zinc metalloprotease FtsH [Clostridia bacterium]
MKKKSTFKHILFYLVLIVAVVLICAMLFRSEAPDKMSYSDVVSAFKEEEVLEFEINKNNVLKMTFDKDSAYAKYKNAGQNKDGTEVYVEYRLASLSIFHADLGDTIVEQMTPHPTVDENGNTIEDTHVLKGEYVAPTEYAAWLSYLPMILIVVALIVMYIIMTRQLSGSGSGGGKMGMGNFSKARAKMADAQAKDKVTFRDVAGADEEKEELEEVVEFLKDPTRFAKLGAKIPHGVLLMGPPGTGKTLLAKAVAGEAGVPFFSISGSDFVEMYVGVGASRVRDLFDTARKSPASIIFIDEIDAVGRHRGAGLGGGHDEREQTLNQLLVEMDGFGSHDGIIVIAATNRPDILDPALLRPGRFDRQITVNYPDINGRVEILKVHSRNKPLESSVDFKEIARMTVGFTGADLANLLNEAALLATRRGKSLIGMDDVNDAFIRVIAGPKKKARVMKESEKRNTAYHEAGHAMVAYHLDLDPVQQISIIPSGRALGYTLNPPKEDKYSEYKSEMKNQISMLLGGRAAEEIVNGDVSGGASNDIDRATKIAKKMITRLGMSDVLGPRSFGTDQSEVFLGRDFSSSQDYSEEVAAKIDSEMHEVISASYEKAKEILKKDIHKLHFIAEFLVKNEIMDGDQFKAVMESEFPVMEEIEAIAEEKKRKSEEANARRIQQEEARARLEAEAERLEKEEEKAEAEANGTAPEANNESADVTAPESGSSSTPENNTSDDTNEENK